MTRSQYMCWTQTSCAVAIVALFMGIAAAELPESRLCEATVYWVRDPRVQSGISFECGCIRTCGITSLIVPDSAIVDVDPCANSIRVDVEEQFICPHRLDQKVSIFEERKKMGVMYRCDVENRALVLSTFGELLFFGRRVELRVTVPPSLRVEKDGTLSAKVSRDNSGGKSLVEVGGEWYELPTVPNYQAAHDHKNGHQYEYMSRPIVWPGRTPPWEREKGPSNQHPEAD